MTGGQAPTDEGDAQEVSRPNTKQQPKAYDSPSKAAITGGQA